MVAILEMKLRGRFWEREWKSIKCAKCEHVGRDHRDITISVPDEKYPGSNKYHTDWSCKKCKCDEFLREDFHAKVKCNKCGIEYWASNAGNPDGVAWCPNGHLDQAFDAYCPSPDGTRYTPEEWDRLYGNKK